MNKMTYKGYTAQMEFDAEDKIIVGRVIDDIITFHACRLLSLRRPCTRRLMVIFLPVNNWARRPRSPPAAA